MIEGRQMPPVVDQRSAHPEGGVLDIAGTMHPVRIFFGSRRRPYMDMDIGAV